MRYSGGTAAGRLAQSRDLFHTGQPRLVEIDSGSCRLGARRGTVAGGIDVTRLSATTGFDDRVDRAALIDWYQRNRERTRTLFDMLASEEAYYHQPIALRHPLVFYEGHLPGFTFNALMKKALGKGSIDATLETLFARGIDPDVASTGGGPAENRRQWPERHVVQAFAAEVDRQVIAALATGDLDRPGDPLLDRAEVVFAVLEHEAMHHETMLYMWHRLPFHLKRTPPDYRPDDGAPAPAQSWIDVPAGHATLGVDRAAVPFAWDNECPALVGHVGAFGVQQHNVTNASFLEFVEAGGYRTARHWRADDWQWIRSEGIQHPSFWEHVGNEWHWRGMFGLIPLPSSWPVYVTQAEALAYARWRGLRLLTEGEYMRAALGSPAGERHHPWGEEPPGSQHGVFDFGSWDPEPAGSHPRGRSAWGVEDLVGNGWEWTSTPFGPFPGFEARASYPEYSADFFDNQHFVVKGASPATARALIRPTFRNWFRPRYPYVYATFRCARDAR